MGSRLGYPNFGKLPNACACTHLGPKYIMLGTRTLGGNSAPASGGGSGSRAPSGEPKAPCQKLRVSKRFTVPALETMEL